MIQVNVKLIARARALLNKAQMSLFPGMVLAPSKADPRKKRWQQMQEETPAPKRPVPKRPAPMPDGPPSMSRTAGERILRTRRMQARIEAASQRTKPGEPSPDVKTYLQGEIAFGSERVTRADAIERLQGAGADANEIDAFLTHADGESLTEHAPAHREPVVPTGGLRGGVGTPEGTQAALDYFADTKAPNAPAAPTPDLESVAPPPEPTRQADHPWALSAVDMAEKPIEDVLKETPAFGVPVGKNTAWRLNTNERAEALLTRPKDQLTDEEKDVLRAYSGEGRTGDGDLTSYYTPPEVTATVWKMLARAGFRGGRVLEPSCGNGGFIHFAPKGCLVTGVELSPTPAAIAERIHPNATIEQMPFERWNTSHASTERFDAVVGNPPFGPRGTLRGMDKSHIGRYEQYFLSAALDRTKPGGFVAFVLPTGIMGIKGNHFSEFRSAMTRKGQVVAALRLPTSTFSRQGTEQTCDVLIMRKLPDEVALARKKLTSDELRAGWSDAESAWVNGNYFHDNPDRVLGRYAPPEKVFRGVVVEGEATPDLLDRATRLPSLDETPPSLEAILAGIESDERREAVQRAVKRDAAALSVDPNAPKVGDVKHDAGVYYRLNENHRWERIEDVAATLCGELGVESFKDLREKAVASGVYMTAAQLRLASLLASPSPEPDSFDEVVRQAAHLSGEAKNPDDAEKISVAALLGWRCRQLQVLQASQRDEDQVKANNLRVRLVRDMQDYEAEFTNPRGDRTLLGLSGRCRALAVVTSAYKEDGALADYLTKRTFHTGTGAAPADPANVASVASWLALRQEKFSAADVASVWTGGDTEAAGAALLADPQLALAGIEGGALMFQPVSRYATGALRKKVAEARELADRIESGVTTLPEDVRQSVMDRLSDQAEMLESMMPRRSIEDIEFNPRSGFVPVAAIEEWVNTDYNGNPATRGLYKIERLPSGAYRCLVRTMDGEWNENNSPYFENYNARKLLNYLNRYNMKADDAAHFENMAKEFRQWVMEHPKWRQVVEDSYNEAFADSIEADYSTAPMDIPGLTHELADRSGQVKPFAPHGVQYRTVRHMMDKGAGIISLDVGVGKTLTGVMLLQALKKEGRCQKPVVVVPKSVLVNWQRAVKKYFPGMDMKKVLVVDGEGARKRQQLHDAANNDWELVIMSQPTLTEIPLRGATQDKYIKDDFWFSRSNIMGSGRSKDKYKTKGPGGAAAAERSLKEQEKAEASFTGKLSATFQSGKRDVLYWEDMGFDAMLVDEFHRFKNLYSPQTEGYKGIKYLPAGGDPKQRALDMAYKMRWIRDHNGGRNVFGLSATPTPNSASEIYTMIAYVAPEEWKRRGVNNVEDFIDRFCQKEPRTVMTTDGGFAQKDTLVGFKNLRELRGLYRQYITHATAQEAGIRIPEGKVISHTVDMPPHTSRVYEGLRARATELSQRGGYDKETGDHILSVLDRMEKASISLPLYYDAEGDAGKNDDMPAKYAALYGAGAEGLYYSPKIDEMVLTAMQSYRNEDGGQLVFCDKLPMHDEVKKRLMLAGVPENEIRIINAQTAQDPKKRQAIADEFNAGKIRFVIGNTETAGEGMSFQKRCSDIHHLDYRWNQSGMHQRNGRGVRQGNPRDEVRVHKYMMKGSFDAYRIDMTDGKRTWQEQIRTGNTDTAAFEDTEEASGEDLKVLLAPDPEKAKQLLAEERAKAKTAIAGFERRKAYESYMKLCQLRARIKRAKTDELRQRLAHQEKLAVESLQRNPHFEHKDFLRTGETLMFTPSGQVLTKGQYVELNFEGKRRLAKVEGLDLERMTVEFRSAVVQGRYGYPERRITVDELMQREPKLVDATADNVARSRIDGVETWSHLLKFTPDERTQYAGELEAAMEGREALVRGRDGKLEWVYGYRPGEGQKLVMPTPDNYLELYRWIEKRAGPYAYGNIGAAKEQLEALVPEKDRAPKHDPNQAAFGVGRSPLGRRGRRW